MLDDDTSACAKLVETGDPLRFRTVMAAPRTLRPTLFALYAFNVEVARAPWLTAEPMIAEMRLQWWRDALDEIASGGPVRRHMVTTPLSQLLTPEDARRLDASVAARRWDIYREPFEDAAHFDAYLDQTAGHLMWTAARLTGGGDAPAIRALAYAQGLASFLRAIPALQAAGRIPLIDGSHSGLRQLATSAFDRLAHSPSRATPALWPAIGARQTLSQVRRDPAAVADARLDPGLTSWRLMKTALTGRL